MIIQANALHIPLADQSVQTVVTSPPYWGLRDYGVSGQLGLEPTPEEYVADMVAVFREVKRVLRDDGTCWLNLGDSYAGLGKGAWDRTDVQKEVYVPKPGGPEASIPKVPFGLKPKDLVGIPWRVAFALQADGWYLRSDCIWAKPNPMPESVTDRPTKSHEYVFLLAKRERYYYDAEAIKDPQTESSRERAQYGWSGRTDDLSEGARTGSTFRRMAESGEPIATIPTDGMRNRRTVWTIPTAPYSGAHFATYPPALVEPCIKAGTSERGCCPVCGKPWERVTEKAFMGDGNPYTYEERKIAGNKMRLSGKELAELKLNKPDKFIGWQPTCAHAADPVPCTVLDPFNGSGTTGLVAQQLGRRYVGLDLSWDYLQLSRERLGMTAWEEWQEGVKAGDDGYHDLPLFREAQP